MNTNSNLILFKGKMEKVSKRRCILPSYHLLLIICVVAGLASACSTSKSSFETGLQLPTRGEQGMLPSGRSETRRPITKPRSVTSLPWQTWQLSRDLRGIEVRNIHLLKGDDYWRLGEIELAFKEYNLVTQAKSDFELMEAVNARLAGALLAMGKAKDALATLSEFIRINGGDVNKVPGEIALIMAYAYGTLGDSTQSLAWFSMVARSGRTNIRYGAEQGIEMLLKSVSDAELDQVSAAWSNDALIRSKAAQERRRRSVGNIVVSKNELVGQPFWQPQSQQYLGSDFNWDQQSQLSSAESATIKTARFVLSALLPLSGEFAGLGQSTLNGMNMAFAGQGLSGEFAFVAKDTQGSPFQSVNLAREVVASKSEGAQVVFLGPLITAEAQAVAEFAELQGTPLISMSKASYFPTSQNVFRLGATVPSQISDLLDRWKEVGGSRDIGVIFPLNELGQEAATAFRDVAGQLGYQLQFEGSYSPGDQNAMVTLAEEIENSRVDAVFIPDDLVLAARFLGSMKPIYRRRITPLGLGTWDNPGKIIHSGAVLDGAVFVSPFFLENSSDLVKQFRASYRASYGTEPNFLAAQGFDLATMAIFAAQRAATEGITFNHAMLGIQDYEGLTGRISVLENGEISRKFKVLRFKSGRFSELERAISLPKVLPVESEAKKVVPMIVVKENEVLKGKEVLVPKKPSTPQIRKRENLH